MSLKSRVLDSVLNPLKHILVVKMHLKLRIMQHGEMAWLNPQKTINLNGDEYRLHGVYRHVSKRAMDDYLKHDIEYYNPEAEEILIIPIDNITYGSSRCHSRVAAYVKDCI